MAGRSRTPRRPPRIGDEPRLQAIGTLRPPATDNSPPLRMSGQQMGTRRGPWWLARLIAASGLLAFAASCASTTSSPPRPGSGSPHRSSTTTSTTGPPLTSPVTTASAVPSTTVVPVPVLAITSGSSAVAFAGEPFTFMVTTSCPSVPVIRATGLPHGLTLVDGGNCTATIRGTPATSEAGVHTASVVASIPGGEIADQRLVLTIDDAPLLKVRRALTLRVGVPFEYLVSTDHGQPTPSIITSSPLPAGVQLADNRNGTATLSGTPGPGTGGVYPAVITASNGVGAPATGTITLTVDQIPVITSVPGAAATAGIPMVPFTVTVTGYPTARIRAVGLPEGLTLVDHGNGTATIDGTAVTAGAKVVMVFARNALGLGSQSLSVTVAP